MVDIETMGNNPRSAIVSIGAVAFDPMGNEPLNELPSFYVNVDLQSCLDAGLVADGSTIMWWLNQSEAARKALKDPTPMSIQTALASLHGWLSMSTVFSDPQNTELWAHATFDPVILRSALDVCHLPLPWKYRNTRDIRTLVGLAKQVGMEIPASGGDNTNRDVHHQAADDCRYQVGYVRSMYQQIIGRNLAAKAA
jgi:hypothetical protein